MPPSQEQALPQAPPAVHPAQPQQQPEPQPQATTAPAAPGVGDEPEEGLPGLPGGVGALLAGLSDPARAGVVWGRVRVVVLRLMKEGECSAAQQISTSQAILACETEVARCAFVAGPLTAAQEAWDLGERGAACDMLVRAARRLPSEAV